MSPGKTDKTSSKASERVCLGATSQKILEVLMAHPKGLDIHQIRQLCPEEASSQAQFDRRKRDIYRHHLVEGRHEGGRYVYRYIRPLTEEEKDQGEISEKDRAKVIHAAHGRCQMCGRTVGQDGIRLQADHKIPRDWGGQPSADNLWAICEQCNRGKKNYFRTFDSIAMRRVLEAESVHRRILLLLHMNQGQPVEADLIAFVANFNDYQEDWRKRLRELRYFGLEISSSRRKRGKRVVSYYSLDNWVADLPDDLSEAARAYERDRAEANRARKKGNGKPEG